MKVATLTLFLALFCSKSFYGTNVDFNANKVCFGNYTTLVATASIDDTLIASYRWDFNDDGIYNDAFGKIITHLFSEADTFFVKVKVVTTDGTEYTMPAPKEVIVYPIPVANFSTENICYGQPALFICNSSITSGAITQFKWDFNNDGNIDYFDTLPNSASFNFGAAGTYTTKLELVSDHQCNAVAMKSTEIFAKPIANYTIQNTCVDGNTLFTNQTNPQGGALSYCLWDFGDGQVATSASNTTHTYVTGGSYGTKLIAVSTHNCKDTFNLNITINPRPILNFTFYGDTIFYEGNTVTVTASGDFSSISWSTGQTTQAITVSQQDAFTATATNNYGCSIQKSFITDVIQASQPVVLSNILTPNGDGINDYFCIENARHFSKCKLYIYNMNGGVVFWSNDTYYNNWDGKLNGDGQTLDAGAYYYIIETENGKTKGCFNIVK